MDFVFLPYLLSLDPFVRRLENDVFLLARLLSAQPILLSLSMGSIWVNSSLGGVPFVRGFEKGRREDGFRHGGWSESGEEG